MTRRAPRQRSCERRAFLLTVATLASGCTVGAPPNPRPCTIHDVLTLHAGTYDGFDFTGRGSALLAVETSGHIQTTAFDFDGAPLRTATFDGRDPRAANWVGPDGSVFEVTFLDSAGVARMTLVDVLGHPFPSPEVPPARDGRTATPGCACFSGVHAWIDEAPDGVHVTLTSAGSPEVVLAGTEASAAVFWNGTLDVPQPMATFVTRLDAYRALVTPLWSDGHTDDAVTLGDPSDVLVAARALGWQSNGVALAVQHADETFAIDTVENGARRTRWHGEGPVVAMDASNSSDFDLGVATAEQEPDGRVTIALSVETLRVGRSAPYVLATGVELAAPARVRVERLDSGRFMVVWAEPSAIRARIVTCGRGT